MHALKCYVKNAITFDKRATIENGREIRDQHVKIHHVMYKTKKKFLD